jgi:membrane-associated protein
VTGWMGSVPALAALLLVALVLLAEAGLLIGVVLPAASLVLGLGVLAGAGLLPLWAAAATAAGATVVGAALGHRAAARDGAGHLLPAGGLLRRLLPARAVRVVDRSAAGWAEVIGRRPVRAAATAQFVTGARTLAPRLAGMTGVPLRTVLRGTVPAALVWSSALVAAGAAAGAALPWLRGAVTVVGVPFVVAVSGLLLHRRRAQAPSVGRPTDGACRLGRPGAVRHHRDAGAGPDAVLGVAVLLTALAMALLTLAPTGRPGWAWGSRLLPYVEMRHAGGTAFV